MDEKRQTSNSSLVVFILNDVYIRSIFSIKKMWSSGSVLDHRHPCSNPGMGISEGCFVFHFVSLPLALEVARSI